MAADTMKVWGGYRVPCHVEKLRQVGDTVFALTGHAALFDPFVEWYLAGANPKEVPGKEDDETSLIVFREGRCFVYKPKLPYADEAFAPDAWGGGGDFAIGAMRAGKSAEEAVRIAMDCTISSGGQVQVIELPGRLWGKGVDSHRIAAENTICA